VTSRCVHGAHFLPVPGADRAKVFLSLSKSYILSANCTSSTVCTVTLPALSARVVNVQISAEDSNYSGYVTADRPLASFDARPAPPP
jgi:hypothetical protein